MELTGKAKAEIEKIKQKALESYINENKNQDECIGFIECWDRAFNAALELAAEKIEKRFAVSLVYRKSEQFREAIILRSLTTEANSKEEALGKTISFFEEETKEYSLSMKTVLPANYMDSILSLKIPDTK